MLHTYKISAFTLLMLLFFFTGCQRFEPVTCEITTYNSDGKTLTATAAIIDNGGTDYFAEQGFCYSLYDTLSATDVYTTMVPLHYSTDSLTFSWKYELPMADTVYYICAYVKNNAGIAYSATKEVSTKTSK